MKKTLLILIALFTVVMGYSQTVGDTFVENFITYEVTSITPNRVQITNYNTTGGTDVNIPDTITNASIAYSVTSIGTNAFKDNSLTSVKIPNSVTVIRSYSFQNNNLTHITFPENTSNIQSFSFIGNPITNVISKNIVPPPLGGSAFDNLNTINLTVPIGTSSLYNTNWSGFASVTEAAPLTVGDTFVVDFITYNVTSVAPETVQTLDYDMAGGTVVNIPATVSFALATYCVNAIGQQSFFDNGLTSVTIGSNVTDIEFNAFYQNQLTSIIIPNNVINIKARAFDENLLTSATIGSNVTTIAFGAFMNNPLTSIKSLATVPPTIITSPISLPQTDSFGYDRSAINLIIPYGSTNEYATDSGALWTGFKMVHVITSTSPAEVMVTDYDAANGTNVTISATVTDGTIVYDVKEIGIAAFFDKGLTSVTIPNSVTVIGTSAFNTNNLTSVTIPDSVIIIGGQAFQTNDLTNVTLGSSVDNIGFAAFIDNDLTSITFPSSVTAIGSVAFAANPLTTVTSLAITPPTITTGTNDTFNISGDRSNINLTIPNGTENAYIAAQWINFASVTLNNSDFELANDIKVINTSEELKVITSDAVKLETYTIYSISGAKAKEGTESTIAIETLHNGIYILELTFDAGRLVKKFAK